jgi:hypothetical protein
MEKLNNDSEDCATPSLSNQGVDQRVWNQTKGTTSHGRYEQLLVRRKAGVHWPMKKPTTSSNEGDEVSSNRQRRRRQHPPPSHRMDDNALTPSDDDVEQYDRDDHCVLPALLSVDP